MLSTINLPEKLSVTPRKEIDDKKWNGCVHFSSLGLPYAYTWFLDNVCDEWDGIVLGDYRAVFPLVNNEKWKQHYLFQPLFCQQLGIVSNTKLEREIGELFIKSIPEKYGLIEIALNENNNGWDYKGFEALERPNMYLYLNKSYEEMYKGYSKNTKRNIEEAKDKGLYLNFQLKPEQFADFYLNHTAPLVKEFKKHHYYRILRLVYKAQQYSMGILVGVHDKNKELIGASFLPRTPKRIINLMPSSSKSGRESKAMFFLTDALIRMNENKQLIFDFEGSGIEGVARFNKGFGAEEVSYPFLQRNHLPFYIKWAKSILSKK